MATVILSLVFMLIVVAGMAVGVIFSNRPIKGSCGGIQQLGLGGECEICGGDTNRCETRARPSAKPLPAFYDATRK